MRVVKTQVEEPAYVNEITSYECEQCDFKTEDEDDGKYHLAEKHSFRAEKCMGKRKFLWFDDAESYRSYHQDGDSSDTNCLCYEAKRFEGPGWYEMQSWDEPCGRGCCNRYYYAGFSLRSVRDELLSKRERLQKEIEALDTLMNEVPSDKEPPMAPNGT